jgi:competence ComEA-like helix-hairpin-helix protein
MRFLRNFWNPAVDIDFMKTSPVHTSIAIILSILALVAVCGRLGLSERLSTSGGPDLSPAGSLCVGFADRGGEIIGLAYAESAADLIATRISRLGLPEACGPLELPADLETGALVRLRLGDGGCALGSIDRLPGPQRLVCGAGIDVNRDPARDIELLPGIGPKKAGAIVESRTNHGPFESLDDLERVKGIGGKTVERIRPWAEPVR